MANKPYSFLIATAALSLSTLAAAQQPIVLKFNSPAPLRSFLHLAAFTPWAEDVTKASEGTLKVDTFYGGTLGNFGVTYDRVVDGVADIGFIVASFAQGKFRLHEVGALPFESRNSMEASTALWKIYEKGVTASEFSEVRPIGIFVFSNAAIHSKEPIRAVADMKGRKITTGNSVTAKIVITLGGTPVTFRPDELYQVLMRGTADGSLINFSAVRTFKLSEVVKHHVDLPLGGDPALVIMSRKKYDSLPAKAKATIDRYSNLQFSQKLARLADEDWTGAHDSVKDRITPISAQEEDRWRKALAPVAVAWSKEVPNGAKAVAAFRQEVKAFRATSK